ncbi:YceI family protein [Actinomadura harenae]|uniref:Polyisoprenoid-binding protein n=1 Tax=Actinomadura harenae TaxID=2483351 RepID=A0A3M2LP06_9ACTN|nr:YceI family protein [Actinomadura harenae]RMI39201.1 polyisoprenoid-binding protein [Actinomadura harenae]
MTTLTGLSELAGDYTLDAGRSRLGFVARHTVGGKVRGRFSEVEGTARLDAGDPAASRVRLTLRAESLDTGNAQRDGLVCGMLLKSGDHPVLTFVSTEVRILNESAFRITGGLTVRGTTKPLTMDFQVTGTDPGGVVTAVGRTAVLSTGWGVKTVMTRPFISAKVELEIEVTAVRLP